MDVSHSEFEAAGEAMRIANPATAAGSMFDATDVCSPRAEAFGLVDRTSGPVTANSDRLDAADPSPPRLEAVEQTDNSMNSIITDSVTFDATDLCSPHREPVDLEDSPTTSAMANALIFDQADVSPPRSEPVDPPVRTSTPATADKIMADAVGLSSPHPSPLRQADSTMAAATAGSTAGNTADSTAGKTAGNTATATAGQGVEDAAEDRQPVSEGSDQAELAADVAACTVPVAKLLPTAIYDPFAAVDDPESPLPRRQRLSVPTSSAGTPPSDPAGSDGGSDVPPPLAVELHKGAAAEAEQHAVMATSGISVVDELADAPILGGVDTLIGWVRLLFLHRDSQTVGFVLQSLIAKAWTGSKLSDCVCLIACCLRCLIVGCWEAVSHNCVSTLSSCRVAVCHALFFPDLTSVNGCDWTCCQGLQ